VGHDTDLFLFTQLSHKEQRVIHDANPANHLFESGTLNKMRITCNTVFELRIYHGGTAEEAMAHVHTNVCPNTHGGALCGFWDPTGRGLAARYIKRPCEEVVRLKFLAARGYPDVQG